MLNKCLSILKGAKKLEKSWQISREVFQLEARGRKQTVGEHITPHNIIIVLGSLVSRTFLSKWLLEY